MTVPQLRVEEARLDNLDAFYDDLTATYAAEAVVLCPMNNPIPIPSKGDCKNHLLKGRRLVGLYRGGDLTHVLLVDEGRIRTCFSRVDKQAMGEAQWIFVDYFNEIGEKWVLDTGTPGWVTRTYFERYAPAGGPFDVAVHQPGLPEGTTYGDFDDCEWTLTIHSRHLWEVSLRG